MAGKAALFGAMMPPKISNSPYAEQRLREMVEADADDWVARKTFARFLYDRGDTRQAAELLWAAPEIPSIDFEIAFAARILAKGTPRRAIRLLDAVLDQNRGKPVQNLGLANALLHHGMVMQAARFYGAAIEGDVSGAMLNADLEHFLLWVDDREKLWGEFEGKRDELDELPWMNRSAEEAASLRDTMKGHTTPIRIKSLPPIDLEEPKHPMYVQSASYGAEPTPPPAVTIPMDRVAEKDRLYDEKLGAEVAEAAQKVAQPRKLEPPKAVNAPKAGELSHEDRKPRPSSDGILDGLSPEWM